MPRLCDTAEIVAHASQQHQTLDCAASGHAQTRTSAEIRRSRCGYWGRGALALSRSLRVALLVLATTGCTGYVHSDQDPGSENCESGSCSEGVTPPDSGE